MTVSNITGSASADAGAADAPVLVVDGPCLASTVERLSAGYPPSRPLNGSVVETIREQALSLVADVVRAYAQHVAVGEVGSGGTARASVDQIGLPPTGLLYGRIQSGKTNAMILAAAAAIDNGFRTIVVLTSDNVELVKQTAQRFRILDSGPLVYSSTTGQWVDEVTNIRTQLAPHGAVFICSKNKDQLAALYRVLADIGASDFPALIFDDEADQATPDTTTQSKALGKNPSQDASTINRKIVQNTAQNEQGESIREVLRHNVFVQVTATPYALLLQNTDSPLRPSFTRLLDPGVGYNGGEDFFSAAHLDDELPPLVYVSATDSSLTAGNEPWAPDGLSKAIAFFLLSATALERLKGKAEPEGYKFLCHTSSQRADHDRFTTVIRTHVNALLDGDGGIATGQESNIRWAYESLAVTQSALPPFDDLLGLLRKRLHQRRFLTVNSDRGPGEYGSAYNFVVGGNILGRGLTIEKLLVTYYMRMPKTTQMDTMLQHARMFGYRGELMPFTRVFVPPVLAARFGQIAESEVALRALLTIQDPQTPIPVHIIGGLRPTRANVLNPNFIGGFRSGQQVYPRVPAFEPDVIGSSLERIEELIQRIGGSTWKEFNGRFVGCSTEELISLVETVRSGDPGAGDWDSEALANVLRSISAQYGGRCLLSVRTFKTPKRKLPILPTGAIGHSEQERAHVENLPTLFMLRHEGTSPFSGVPFWYPTVVFPKTMANQVFNVS